MEKILILNGSPKGKNGNTAKLVEYFMKGYSGVKKDIHVDYVELCEKDIKNCIGCFTCWKETPGKCIHRDDMDELLPKYIDSDFIIWATPLYYCGMTSILKKFVERTLPINEPYIAKKDEEYTHTQRYDGLKMRNIVISNCGFPERQNFDVMIQSFKMITEDSIDENICCVMGELLSVEPLHSRIKWYKEAVQKAGEEYAVYGKIQQDTKEILVKPLVPVEEYIEMANLSWQVEGE